MAFHGAALDNKAPQETLLQGVAFKGTLAQLSDLQLRYELQNRVLHAAASQQRNIECVLKCGGQSCEHLVFQAVSQIYQSESTISVPETKNEEAAHDALPETKQDLPMLLGGPRRKTPEEIRAAEAASRYSMAKRCNCLTHQKRKRESWSPSSSHEANKVRGAGSMVL